MNRDPSDTWPEREPNALDAAARIASDLIYAACYLVILGAPLVLWIMTPAGMR